MAAGGAMKMRGIIVQKKTGRPVQFEITEHTTNTVAALIRRHDLSAQDYLFPSRLADSPHLSTRQYARIVQGWVSSIGLNPATYGIHSLRRTKAALIYRETGNLRAVGLCRQTDRLDPFICKSHVLYKSIRRAPITGADRTIEIQREVAPLAAMVQNLTVWTPNTPRIQSRKSRTTSARLVSLRTSCRASG